MSGEINPTSVGEACPTPEEATRRRIAGAACFTYGVVVYACQEPDVNLCFGVESRAPSHPAMLRLISYAATNRRLEGYEEKGLKKPPEYREPQERKPDICCEPLVPTIELGTQDGDRLFAARELKPFYGKTLLVATDPVGHHRKKDQGPLLLTQMAMHPPTFTFIAGPKGIYPTYEGGLDGIQGQNLSAEGRFAKVVEHVQEHPHTDLEGHEMQCTWGYVIDAAVVPPVQPETTTH